jgi:hypothetical protein
VEPPRRGRRRVRTPRRDIPRRGPGDRAATPVTTERTPSLHPCQIDGPSDRVRSGPNRSDRVRKGPKAESPEPSASSIRSDQVRLSPIRSDQVRSGPIRSDQVRSGPNRSAQVRTGPKPRAQSRPPVWSGPVRSGQVQTGPSGSRRVRSGPIRSEQVRSGPIRSDAERQSDRVRPGPRGRRDRSVSARARQWVAVTSPAGARTLEAAPRFRRRRSPPCAWRRSPAPLSGKAAGGTR